MTKGKASFYKGGEYGVWPQKPRDGAAENDIKNIEGAGQEGTKNVALVADTKRNVCCGRCATK